ncbi:hypothetical protein P872_21195 [Rhodonellum psychrophilum GCM71 = DSM 17998]|uniref:Uncharacterized protein n=1 Tax=Rhodonellum psychrophilum GCM71 = DSM 17998 TaxID=1123057 RepID=U5BJZ7_9BACT|nr:hypothetical protein P872_21195 [Rhodonellum psychrophilum GCM71 = DSM 17998]
MGSTSKEAINPDYDLLDFIICRKHSRHTQTQCNPECLIHSKSRLDERILFS